LQNGMTFLREYTNLSPSATLRHRVVSGHTDFGVHRVFASPCAYVTLLREPMDRVVSFYYYARRSPEMYLHQRANRMSLQEFVAHGDTLELDNLQVRVLAGRTAAPFGTLTAADLHQAKANLLAHFAVVGSQSNVAGFLKALCERFGFSHRWIPPQNVTWNRPRLSEISATAREIIQDGNALDMELHRFAESQFFPQIPPASGPVWSLPMQLLRRAIGRIYESARPAVEHADNSQQTEVRPSRQL
jgi:hypothetical protein